MLDYLLVNVGGIIGSAIFLFSGPPGPLVGSTTILAWLGAGLLTMGIAPPYTELSLAFPEAGAPAVFPYEALGPKPTVRAFASYIPTLSEPEVRDGRESSIRLTRESPRFSAGRMSTGAGGPTLAIVAFLALAVAMVGLGLTEVVWSLGALGILTVYFPLWFVLQKLFPAAFREPSLRD